MSYRYYSTQRPVMPGGFPKPQGSTVLEIKNFDVRTFCTEIGREAWGYIEYSDPLTEHEAASYELVAPKSEPKMKRLCITYHMRNAKEDAETCFTLPATERFAEALIRGTPEHSDEAGAIMRTHRIAEYMAYMQGYKFTEIVDVREVKNVCICQAKA